MTFLVIITLSMLTFTAVMGSRFLISLYALELGTSAFGIGVLISLYALFPLLLGVVAGRTSDRFGVRRPMVYGSLGVGVGLALPFLITHTAVLYVSAAAIGMSFVFFNVAMQNLVPSIPGKGQQAPDAEQRTRNVGNFSLGISVAQFCGPLLVGFSIDHLRYSATYGVLACISILPAIVLLMFPRLIPRRTRKAAQDVKTSPLDLLKSSYMRRTLITSGVIVAGIDLFTFYMPIYGRSIGLSASVIGLLLATFAAAQFVVRFFMTPLVKRFGEDGLFTYALVLAAVTYLCFPIFRLPLVLGGIAFVLGLGLGLGQPLSMMMIYNRSPLGRSGEALGMRFTVVNFGHMVIPLIFGSLGAAFGLLPVFWGNALFLGIGGYINSRRGPEQPTPRS